MAHPPDDLGFLVNTLARRLRTAMAEELRSTGITPQQAAVVLFIDRAGSATPAACAQHVGTDRATMTGILERLAARGVVASSENPADARSRLISLTEAGRLLVPQLYSAAERANRWVDERIGAQQADQLRSVLCSAVAAIELGETR